MAWLTLRTGRYRIAEQVDLTVGGSAIGTSIVLHDRRRSVHYSVSISLEGRLVSAEARPYGPAIAEPVVARAAGGAPRNRDPVPLHYLEETGLRFTVRYPSTPLPDCEARVLAGWTDGVTVVLFYRHARAGVFFDEVGRLAPDGTFSTTGAHGCGYLPPGDRQRFDHLPAGATFKLRRKAWVKMSLPELRAAADGKQFDCSL